MVRDYLEKMIEPRIAAYIGVLAPLVAFLSIGISIALSPWFSWDNHALSDLGVSPVAPIFNVGLMVTGILLAIFAIAFARTVRDNTLMYAGSISLLILGLGVVGIDIFTEATIGLHILFAMICFGSLLFSTLLFGIRYALDRGVSRSRITRVLVVAGVVITIAMGAFRIMSPDPAVSPRELLDLYRNPPPEFITPEGKVDYLRLTGYIREQLKTEYGITMPGIAIMELLYALPIVPFYVMLSLKLYRTPRSR